MPTITQDDFGVYWVRECGRHVACKTLKQAEAVARRLMTPENEPEIERLIFTLEVKIAEFEKALEERFKPALTKAISEVVQDFLEDTEEEFIEVTEKPKDCPFYFYPVNEETVEKIEKKINRCIRKSVREALEEAKASSNG